MVSLICLSNVALAQISIQSAEESPFTPINIVENVLLGTGVELNEIIYNGTNSAVGVFSNGSSYIGLERGIVLSTGFVKTIEEENNDNTNAKGGTSNLSLEDDDLQLIAGDSSTILDIARYEIKFVPESDTLRFRYVFASEEYPEFVCSDFNDVFGFFISGPNPDGGNYNALNIARVPDPNDPSGNTFLMDNVAINTVNSGSIGTLGAIDVANCSGINGSLAFSQYYNEVPTNEFPVFDAYLDIFIAKAAVIPCEEYTIKLAIADVKDQDFDSAVFLEGSSLYSPSLSVNLHSESNDGSIAEGCSVAEMVIEIPSPRNSNTNIPITSLPNGSFPDQADSGIDFLALPGNISIPAGQTSATITFEAIEDNIVEGEEYIYLDIQRSVCKRDTVKIKIRDNRLTQVMLPVDTSICANAILRLVPEYDPPLEEVEPMTFISTDEIILEESGVSYTSTINVQDVDVTDLNGGILTMVCIDTLVSRNLTDIELFLKAPQGQILELSTNNGLRVKPAICETNPNNSVCIDAFYNTCFTVDAGVNINNGNANLGTVFTGNENYTGSYLPEGDWNKLLIEGATSNGSWQLLMKSDSVSTLDIANDQSYLGSWSMHFGSSYEVNHVWSPNYNINCTECDNTFVSPDLDVTYKLNVTDSYGCTSYEEIRVEVHPVPEIPSFLTCEVLSPSSIEVQWEDLGPDALFYNISQNFVPPFFETMGTSFIFEGLEAGTDQVFYLAASNEFCTTSLDSISCTTPPCMNGPAIDLIETIAPSCIGRNDGKIIASATAFDGGIINYYVNGQKNITGEFNFFPAGEYLLRVVDSDGCSTVETVVIPMAEDIQYNVLGQSISCVGESDAVAEINILESESEPYSILWQNLSEEFIQENLAMGTYFFTITDGDGCNYEKSITIVDPEPLVFAEIDAQQPPCYGEQGSIKINISGGTPDYSYEWEDTNENTAEVNFFPGTYNLTVTDDNGCSISNEIIIEERLEIELIQDTILAVCGGELSQEIELEIMGGQAPFEVNWGSGINGIEVEDIPVGFYELTITDDNNCEQLESIYIDFYPDLEIEFDLREPDCFNIENGIISLRSTIYENGVELQEPDRVIIWEDGNTEEAIGNLAGDSTYQYTLVDGYGCRHKDSIYLPSPPAIIINVDTINLLDCFGDENGSFGIEVSGGEGDLVIEWSENITMLQNNIASDLSAGLYSVTVTDQVPDQQNFCTLVNDFALIQPEELQFVGDVQDVKCFEEETGEIDGEILGGTFPFEVEWNNGSISDTITNLSAGIYEVIVTDAHGCTVEESFEIEQPEDPFELAYQTFKTECFMTETGSIDILANGGTMPYNFILDSINYFDNTSITGLAAGTYQLIAIDGNGCELIFNNLVIMETDEIFVSLPSDTTVLFGSSLELEFMTNANNLTNYIWEVSSPEVELSCYDCPGPTIESVTTNFFVDLTVRDANGCKYSTNRYNINVIDDSFISVPTGFSPNSDNRNDKLIIFGKEGVKVMNFEIFDRWGELILSVEEIEIPDDNQYLVWDGTFNGQEVDSGVYIWKVQIEKLNGEIGYLEGSITLLR